MAQSPNLYGFHAIYNHLYTNWTDLETKIAQLPTTKERGDAFEQFCYFFFLYHKDVYRITEVWCDAVQSRKIPDSLRTQYKLRRTDFGVDGVSVLDDGRIEAWQAKFRSDRSSPSVRELSTFWAEAEYADIRRIIANSESLPERAGVRKAHLQTLIDRFITLPEEFFSALHSFANHSQPSVTRQRYSPLPHQEKIIEEVVYGLQQSDRGKLIAACGIGKTLTALWITEEIKAQRVLLLAPSIALVGQTLREWVMHRTDSFSYLGVCSDPTIDRQSLEADISTSDLDFSVTTQVDEIVRWFQSTHDHRQYVFCTYHSAPVIEEALRALENYSFDIIIFDEAHRTVGKADQTFATALSDDHIPSAKRLFMTATEKLISPRVAALAEQAGQVIFSMSDEAVYGPTLSEFNFGHAIKAGIIADYEIVLAEVTDPDEQQRIQKNRLVQFEMDGSVFEISAYELFKALFLLKSLSEQRVTKTITFHTFRKNAIAFHQALTSLSSQVLSVSPYLSYVLGDQPVADRVVRINQFERASIGVLGNVQVLSEGVDIPLIDSVYFVDSKTSLIDLVQAIGRALRKPYGSNTNKVAKIIVPILIPEGIETLDDINWDETLATFHNVIQAMRNQDEFLAEEIDAVNEYVVTNGQRGKRIGGTGSKFSIHAPHLNLRESISLEDFLQRLTIRVATANANPDGSSIGFSHLGQGQRKSEYDSYFTPMGDYNPAPYKDSLVLPTLALFSTEIDILTSAEIEINNNNRSHCRYLGVIEEVDNRRYQLTDLGKLVYRGKVSFETVFRNQMLLFESKGIYPYRLILQILLEAEYLTHYEFLFGPYTIQPDAQGGFSTEEATHRVQFMRERFPQIERTSLANRDTVREQLNQVNSVEISDKDLWGDRTTVNNKFRYIKNALALFPFIDAGDGGFRTPLRLHLEHRELVQHILNVSSPSLAPMPDHYGSWLWIQELSL